MNLLSVFFFFICYYFAASGARVGHSSSSHQQKKIGHPVWKTLDGKPSIFFAHRGEKVLLPEHTIPAYKVASILGADFVEPDLCLTKDDQLVCHHDLFLRDGTDVADHPELQHLKRDTRDGQGNWFIRDLTLAQLKTLRVRQKRVGVRPTDFDGHFQIPTFQEFLDAMGEMTIKLNGSFGISPELKDPSYHNEGKGVNFMENIFLDVLTKNGYPDDNCWGSVGGNGDSKIKIKCPHLIIQSFERSALEYLKNKTSKYELLMLADDDLTLLTRRGMEEVGKFANYYCVWKEYLHVGVDTYLTFIKKNWDHDLVSKMGGFVPAGEFPKVAHQNGMKMAVYTVYDSREPSRRGCAYYGKGPVCDAVRVGDKREELNQFFKMGVDGFFIENLPEGREIRRDFSHHLHIEAMASAATEPFSLVKNFFIVILIGATLNCLQYN